MRNNIFYSAFSIICVLSMAFGIPLMIRNIGRDQIAMFIWMGVAITGFIGLCICALILKLDHDKQKKDQGDDNNE